jgi:hypothetical protein
MKIFSHMQVYSVSASRDHFTSHGLHLNSQGKKWIVNKWASIINLILSKSRVISVTTLPWMEKSDNSYDEQKHRKELVSEGLNMPKDNHSPSKEETFHSAPEVEVVSECSEEEALNENPGSPTSKTNEKCKSNDGEHAKYIVPKRVLTHSLGDEGDTEEVIDVMPNTGTIHKSNRIKNPPSVKLDDFL